jgi:hypothetical protein
MKKLFYVFANWRQEDIEFLNTLKISNKIEKGADSFSIEEGNDYDNFTHFYSKKDSLFKKTKPKEFRIQQANCIFSKEELGDAKYYALSGIHQANNGFPEPHNGLAYQDIIFTFENKEFVVNKRQIAPFRVKQPKWKKNQVSFSLEWEFEFVFFKKEFFQDVLAPLGLKSMEVLDKKRNPLEDTVQLIIPLAKSKILLENSAYDIHPKEERGGFKQYALQTLDFFPPFEKEFDFHICYSQEELLRGHRKIIISKKFCNLLIKHKIIEYNTWSLTPLKNK